MASQCIQSVAVGNPISPISFFYSADTGRSCDPTTETAPAPPVSVQQLEGLSSNGRSERSGPAAVLPLLPLLGLTADIALAKQEAHAAHERHLRHIGADLHDGPAQLLALALLHLTAVVPAKPSVDVAAAAAAMRDAIIDALREIRDISVGLVLPELDSRDAAAAVRLAVDTYQRRTGCTVAVDDAGLFASFNPAKALKICLYRLVQEGLQNGFKHAKGASQSVTVRSVRAADGHSATLIVEVCDHRSDTCLGSGNTNSKETWPQTRERADGSATGLGLAGLKERIDALNGTFDVNTTAGGTMLTAQFAIATDK